MCVCTRISSSGFLYFRARGQIVEEEGYASIDGAECQYAVVNKSTTLLTTEPILAPPVENKSMEIQPQPKTTPGAGELIYIELDLEALSAKPTHPKTAGTLQRPSTPTEYVDIDFARTLALALEDANTDDK
ncbi:hypothetical protein DPMN_147705 [Dreissena polymorpha]|uniref:Uncharacterized protein n=1 Tax=Dreissena polymorpha TaxID=45954 RepID=A0A9D4FAD4_DREPO|nr:hypothetical protein DPMN_147705 [Dreissena polymorpha]